MTEPHVHYGPRPTRALLWRRLRVWWRRMPLLELVLTGALVLAAAGLAWNLIDRATDRPYARALGAIDQTLVQTWGRLPKETQEQLSATYQHVGLVPPDQRQ